MSKRKGIIEPPDDTPETAEDESVEVPSQGRFAIPGAVRPAKRSLVGSFILVHGEPKIGKSTFASHFPGAWFIDTQMGQEFIPVREPSRVSTWLEFLELCAFIDTNRPETFADGAPILTIVLDMYNDVFKMCLDYVTQSLNVEDLGELPHGKGWARLTNEFNRVMSKIRMWPYTLVGLCHTRTKEFKTRGRKLDRYEPDLGAAGLRYVQGATDLIMYAHVSTEVMVGDDGQVTGDILEHRSLLCHPTSWAVAGGRMSQFLPEVISLDYTEFIKHFPDTENDTTSKPTSRRRRK